MPDTCLWLGPPLLNLGFYCVFSFALDACEPRVLLFVSSEKFNCFDCSSAMIQGVSWEASMRAKQFVV